MSFGFANQGSVGHRITTTTTSPLYKRKQTDFLPNAALSHRQFKPHPPSYLKHKLNQNKITT